MQYLTIWDLILTPVYFLVLTYIARKQRDKKYPVGDPLRKFYMPGIFAKFGGAIFIGLIYAFYYDGGDTFNYFREAQVINSALGDSVTSWFHLITHASPDAHPEIYQYSSGLYWYDSSSEYTICVITALVSVLGFGSYFPTAILFAFFAFSGIWAMYRTFARIYPAYTKPLAIAFLFIPSTIVWGSGIFKDTVCMFGLGWMTYSTFRIFNSKDFSIKNIFLVVVSFYLIAQIKLYILLGFLPALVFWVLMTYSRRIASVGIRWIVNMFFIALTVGGFLFFTEQFADELNKYSLEKITHTAKVTQEWTNLAAGDEGSVYNIGKMDGTLGGVLKMFPQGAVVTLYRPFPWEVKKPIIALSALEALFLIYFTLQVFFNRKAKPLRQLFRDPNLIFFLIFAFIFASAVGISSGNFGALSRYKIPCLPFYGALLAVMLGEVYKTRAATRPAADRVKRVQPAI